MKVSAGLARGRLASCDCMPCGSGSPAAGSDRSLGLLSPQVSRDEVAEMVQQGSMRPELEQLWAVKSAQQRALQRLCGAAEAGDGGAIKVCVQGWLAYEMKLSRVSKAVGVASRLRVVEWQTVCCTSSGRASLQLHRLPRQHAKYHSRSLQVCLGPRCTHGGHC